MVNQELVEAFGKRIRQLRTDRGISQEELSFLTGFHRTYIGKILKAANQDLKSIYTVDNMDRLTKERRSWLMSRVSSKNTTPELIVRSLVHRLGFRFRLHYEKLPGKPDIAFPSRHKVIFVHGCFWHGHSRCQKGRLPKSNLELWRTKLGKNRRRDRSNVKAIKRVGWQVLIVWQCELKNLDRLKTRITDFLKNTN